MRFSENGLYIERYIKCGNCGVLIYEKKDQQILTHDGVTHCSQWCIDWKIAREKRRREANVSEGSSLCLQLAGGREGGEGEK